MPRSEPFEDVVTAHGATVLRVCRAVVGPVDAEDAWSETFLAALRAWPRLDADANVEAWLVTIAHRKAIDLVRKAARSTPTEHVPDRPARHGNPHDHDPDLWAALATLTDRQRQAVAYHHLAGLPHAEVAIILGSTPAAARRACADGIAALRRTYPLLADDDRDEDPR
ncbi:MULTISPECIES: RNA polymerase sigma factor [Arsenicicoccus]|jgi:RNA polymerase sigma factor (sigma-70 family)|uniref:Sigma-70 family RNA polymerase sigma factor n=1 Tax=Arsenicicoccus bolidensis TaxID=229480 RepID=A0ABS9Q1S9_9MICO|nr:MULTISPECIES: sigma-70 family RNA polymerase sigma factor [Arsenicicoccus]MCG7321833.1 sigma-70 family RNA polymerase sigma factor [Arsenicicoccus bolidensis]